MFHNETLFDQWAEKYDSHIYRLKEQYPFAGYFELVDEIAKIIKGKDKPTLLDLGTGTGLMLSLLKQQYNFEYWGCDFSEKMVAISQERLESKQIIKWDISQEKLLPIKKNNFDFILSAFTLHHFDLNKKIEILENYLSLLNINGKILIADISFDNEQALSAIKNKEGERWDEEEEEGYFLKKNFIKAIEEKNWQIEYKKSSFCAGLFILSNR